MKKIASALLDFDPVLNQFNKKKQLRQGLSVSMQIGNSLWIANDETIALERLSFNLRDQLGNMFFNEHAQFDLRDFIDLPILPFLDEKGKLKIEEIDVEGLDCKDGYLWLVGSHSLKRGKPDPQDGDTAEDNFKKLRKVTSKGNRFILARIPMVREGDMFSLQKTVEEDGQIRFAAQLKGDEEGNELTKLLGDDKLLKDYLNIPGKDNGFDIEGLAVAGDRIFVGLRGPVLRGFAIILEIELEENDHKSQSKLHIRNLKKHALQLEGLGIRDLVVHDGDLLILAGPTMDLDGPVHIYRWKNGANNEAECFIFRGDETLEKLGDIPFGTGDDHAEGIALLTREGATSPDSILVVYDSASPDRNIDASGAVVDIFSL